jgi:hypothetical protein
MKEKFFISKPSFVAISLLMVLWGIFMVCLLILDPSAIFYPAFWISLLGVELCFGLVSVKVCRKIVITEKDFQECYLFFTFKRIAWNEIEDIKAISFPLQNLEMIVFSKCKIPTTTAAQQSFYHARSKAKQFISIQKEEKLNDFLCKMLDKNNYEPLKKYLASNGTSILELSAIERK